MNIYNVPLTLMKTAQLQKITLDGKEILQEIELNTLFPGCVGVLLVFDNPTDAKIACPNATHFLEVRSE